MLQVSPDEAGRSDASSSSYTSMSQSSSDANYMPSEWPSQSCDSLGLRKRSPDVPLVRKVLPHGPSCTSSKVQAVARLEVCMQ